MCDTEIKNQYAKVLRCEKGLKLLPTLTHILRKCTYDWGGDRDFLLASWVCMCVIYSDTMNEELVT